MSCAAHLFFIILTRRIRRAKVFLAWPSSQKTKLWFFLFSNFFHCILFYFDQSIAISNQGNMT